MKTEQTKPEKVVKVSESELLALVAARLDGVVLFPEKIEEAKKFISNISASVI